MKLLPDHYLLVLLDSQLKLVVSEHPPGSSFEVGGKCYTNMGYGEWAGLYDWLRSPSSQVIGVGYWPFDDLRFLCDVVNHLPYITSIKNACLEIYFSQERDYVEKLSLDQDSLYSFVMATNEGELMLVFGAHWLTSTDIKGLLSGN